MRTLPKLIAGALLLLAGACAEAGDPLSIRATGALAGRAVLDRNGNNQVDPGVDLPAVGIPVAVLRGAGDTVATAVTDAAGVARFLEIPVGSYRIAVSPVSLGDSLRLVSVDSARVTVAAADTPVVSLTLGYPVATAAGLGQLPAGRLVTLEGVALHAASAFGDSTLSVRDATGAARVAALPPGTAVAAGDSVRVLGRIGTRAGRPALVESSAFVLGPAQPPVPLEVSTAEAATARGALLDGALVRATGAQVISATQLSTGDVRLRVTDGTGPLEVLLDRDAQITSEEPLLPGVRLDVAGILVPREGSGEFVLKPRGSRDLVATIPERTVAEIRGLAAGTLVALRATALNGLAAFGDNSLHLADPTGSVRALGVSSAFVFAGDSVRIIALVGIQGGQVVLTDGTASVLGKTTVPPPTLLSTQAAATANGGALDAALAEVRGATVEAVATAQTGDVLLQVDDGSGDLIVLIDRDTGIGTAGLAAGAQVDAVGLLVPTGTGTWVLKPRSPADVVKR